MRIQTDWPEVALAEVADELTVGYVGPMTAEYRDSGMPFLRSQNVQPFSINSKDLRFISADFHKRIRKSRLFPGDVVVVRTGTPGTAAVIPEWLLEANCADLVIVRPSQRLNPHYLSYFVNALAVNQISANTVGAVQQHFNIASAKRLRIPLPSRLQQDAIVSILRPLDHKVDVNRQMNRTLEAMGWALFKSWFVDFDPVTAKAAGRQPVGLDAATAALFPERFVGSELGSIPVGWAVSTIGSEVKVVGGSTPSTGEPRYWTPAAVPWVTPRDLARIRGGIVLETERLISTEGLHQISSGILPAGTVLLSSRAPIGYLAIAEVALAVNQGFIAMVCDRRISSHYALCWAEANIDEILARAGGTTFAEISKSSFRPIPVLVPDQAVMLAFTRLVESLHCRRVAATEESRILAALRDVLLPKLLTGEIRVREAEKTVERAGA